MRRRSTTPFRLREFFHKFWPLFLLAGAIPLVSLATVSSTTYSLFSRAEQPNALRLWFEPSTIITSPNTAVTVSIVAELDKPKSLLPSLQFQITSDPSSLALSKVQQDITTPFGGKVILDTITVTPQTTGQYVLTIPSSSISTSGTIPELLSTGKATIIVN